MGNKPSIYDLTDQNLNLCEKEVLALTGLLDIQQKNIKVGEFKNEPVYIRTNICGDETKPKLVLIHGYASSGPLYFKIIGRLAQHFCLILMDMVGMGGSSRPDDYSKQFTP